MLEGEPDERLEMFLTPRDWLRYAVGRFLAADLAFGHGATTALDERVSLAAKLCGEASKSWNRPMSPTTP